MVEVLAFVLLLAFLWFVLEGKPTRFEKLDAILDYYYTQVTKGKQHGNDKTKKGEG